MAERFYTGDTALIPTVILEEDSVNPKPATSLSWTWVKPDGTTDSGGPTVVNQAKATIAITATTLPGIYTLKATFTLTGGVLASAVHSFEVIDPLETSTENTPMTDLELVVDRSWMKLEDLFDSELGGPWLRDETVQSFDSAKLRRFLPDALYYINNWYQPVTSYSETTFPFNVHAPLLSQALLVEGIYHLMRAYVEQPLPAGANISWFDRRDYLQRWQLILGQEEKKLLDWLDLFKKEQMGFGSTSILVGGYGGMAPAPRYMRGRFAWTNRMLQGGYW